MSTLDADLIGAGFSYNIGGDYSSKTGYNFTNLYFYEKYYFNDEFVENKLAWFKDNRFIGLYISIAYLLVIFVLRKWMEGRERYSLRYLLIAWNVGLAIFSIFGTVRMWPEMVYSIREKGLKYSICNSDHVYGVAGHWSFLFVISKVPELFDTVFIVLRKQPLIFLHYYHHSTILAYVWYFYPEASSSNRWFGSMNYFIHSLMYTYYAFRAMRIYVPKRISVIITTLQIGQMIMGLIICFYILYQKQFDSETMTCATSHENIRYSLFMYFSYFILFFDFFLKAYATRSQKKSAAKQE